MSTLFERRAAADLFVGHLLDVVQNGRDAILTYTNMKGEETAVIELRLYNPMDGITPTGESLLLEDKPVISASYRDLKRLMLRIQPLGNATSSFVGSVLDGGGSSGVNGTVTLDMLGRGLEEIIDYADVSQVIQRLIVVVDSAQVPKPGGGPSTTFNA